MALGLDQALELLLAAAAGGLAQAWGPCQELVLALGWEPVLAEALVPDLDQCLVLLLALVLRRLASLLVLLVLLVLGQVWGVLLAALACQRCQVYLECQANLGSRHPTGHSVRHDLEGLLTVRKSAWTFVKSDA